MAELFFYDMFSSGSDPSGIHCSHVFTANTTLHTFIFFYSVKHTSFFFFYIDRISKNIICVLNAFIPFYIFTAQCERLIKTFFHEENRKIFAGSQPPDRPFSKCSSIPEVARLCCAALVLFQHR